MAEALPRLDLGHLAAIIETSNDFVGVAGLDGETWFVNQGGRKLLGFDAQEDLSELRIADYHPPETARLVLEEMVPRILRDGIATFESALRHRDGHDIPVSQMLMLHRDADGNPECFFTVARDISVQKAVEERLRASEERFRLLIDDLPLGVIVLGPSSQVLLSNPKALDLFGLSEDQLHGKVPPDPGWSLVREDGSALPYSELPGIVALRAARSVRNMILGVTRPNKGDRLWLIANAEPQVGRDGAADRVIVTIVDVSERKRTENTLLQSQRLEAMGSLAGGISHDFNNLLTVVTGYVEAVAMTLPADSPEHTDLSIALQATQRGAALTQQLLAFARHRPVVTKVVDLNATMQALEGMLRRLLGEQIDFRTQFASELWSVTADPSQIEQVIMNLVINARDAMVGGGTLTVETKNVELDAAYASAHLGAHAGEHVMLTVTDTGAGIRPEDQGHVFEPFFTTKGLAQGTGLGLATVHGIVTQHGGHIELSSEPNRGTTFRTYLPRAVAKAQKEAEALRSAPPSGAGTLMLVEDEDLVRTYALRVLERAGYRVLSAADPLVAIEVAEEHAGVIDLLVTDVIMPNMNGVQLATQLRARRAELKVLLVSGYSGEALEDHGVLEDGFAFLPKPYAADVLLAKVREVLDKS